MALLTLTFVPDNSLPSAPINLTKVVPVVLKFEPVTVIVVPEAKDVDGEIEFNSGVLSIPINSEPL